MSTIKSSDEHLTLNADGTLKDIKFQANGVEKASISSAGAFTSTTIDATKLTGDLPAISGANLTGVGVAGITSSANATAITIDASENVGISSAPESGISSDVVEVDMGLMSLSIWKGESQPNDSASYGYNCYKTGGFTYNAKKTSSGADNRPVVYEQAYGTHKFRVGAPGSADAAITWTDAMTIQNTGNVLIGGGTAGVGKLYVGAETGTNWSFRARADDYNDGTGSMHLNAKSTSERIIQNFYINNTGVGSIRTSGSSTAFNTSSDYRLKENVDYDWDATTRLKQLKPARFNFIADETNTLVDGFIAHEVSSVVPEAITGQKDAMIPEVLYEEGDELPEGKSIGDVKTAAAIDPQGIDQSKLVPLLVKTIQELEARIAALEA